jgi:hypothetical protein
MKLKITNLAKICMESREPFYAEPGEIVDVDGDTGWTLIGSNLAELAPEEVESRVTASEAESKARRPAAVVKES